MAAAERIYIIPRVAGVLLAIFVLLVIGSGYAFEGIDQETRVLGLSLFALGIIVLFQTNENLRGIFLTCSVTAPAAAGDPIPVVFTLSNTSREPRSGLTIRALPRRIPTQPIFLPSMEPGTAATLTLTLAPLPRGIHPFPTIRVSTVRPAGICYAWKVFQLKCELVVIPRPEGQPLALRTEEGIGDLSDVRPMRPGDAPARTDWKILARTGRWMVRDSAEAENEPLRLRWEQTAHLADPDARLSQLAKWVLEAHHAGKAFVLELGAAHANSFHAACRLLATASPP